MAINNSTISSAYNALSTKYSDVKNNAQRGYQNLDDYATQAQSAYTDAYAAYDKASAAQLKGNTDYIDYQKNLAQRTTADAKRDYDTEYQKVNNRSGTNNEKMKSQGMSGSGYDDTVKGQAYAQEQKQLASADSQLSSKIAELEQQKQQYIYQNDLDKASQIMSRIQEANTLKQYIINQIQSISQTAYSQDYNNRTFDYQKEQDAATMAFNREQFDHTKEYDKLNYDLSVRAQNASEADAAASRENNEKSLALSQQEANNTKAYNDAYLAYLKNGGGSGIE